MADRTSTANAVKKIISDVFALDNEFLFASDLEVIREACAVKSQELKFGERLKIIDNPEVPQTP